MAKKRILVVEDEHDIRELVRYNLEREGYAVSEAESGEEGLNLVRRDDPDLVVLDLMLPETDGLPTRTTRPPRSSCSRRRGRNPTL